MDEPKKSERRQYSIRVRPEIAHALRMLAADSELETGEHVTRSAVVERLVEGELARRGERHA